MVKWFVFFIGASMIYNGFASSHIVNESEFPATEEEKKAAKPTPLTRFVVVASGVATVMYSAFLFAHGYWIKHS